jgi:hypothetical protein
MKPRGLVVLAIVAGALAVVIAIDRWRSAGGGDERASARARVLPPFDRRAVQRVTITRKGGAFSLVRSASAAVPGWRLEAGGSPAADDAVEDLLSALDLAESDRTARLSPEQAGLAPPAAQVQLELPAARLELQLGGTDPTGQGAYARAGAGAPIRVIGRRVLDLVDREALAFRDRRLFPVDPTAVTALAWRDAAGEHELRLVDGRWQNARQEWVDEGRVIEALRRLFALRIVDFHHDDREGSRSLTLTAGAARIAVEGGERGTLTRGAEAVTVPPDDLASAWRALAAAERRDPRLVAMAPETVTAIDLQDAHGRVSLRRVRGAWTFTAPEVPYAADTPAVDAWLARLAAIDVPTRAAGPNVRHLTVEGRFRQQADVSSPPDVHALLAPDPLRFRARDVLSFARFDVRAVERTAGKETQRLTSDDGGTWRATSGTPDAAGAAQAVGVLGNLRAEAFVASAPPGTPAVRWAVDVQAPGEAKPTRHTLDVWMPKPEACVARLDGGATFTPERAACDALRLELIESER